MQKDEYLASGRRWRSRLVGYSQARYPRYLQLVLSASVWRRRTKVKHAGDPIIVVAREMYILFDTHHARVGERRL